MATYPYFVLGPNAALSIAGLLRGPDRTVPTPVEDWRAARVDVVIPAFNEAQTIVFCLAALMRQTLKPRQIILVDDGRYGRHDRQRASVLRAEQRQVDRHPAAQIDWQNADDQAPGP